MEKVFRYPVKDAAGMELPLLKIPFKGDQDGGMTRAFFDKDAGDFAQAVKAKDIEAQDKLRPERFGELEAFQAWMKLGDAALGDAVFAALRDARMRVFPQHLDEIVRVIGQERAMQCPSLPKGLRVSVPSGAKEDVEQRP